MQFNENLAKPQNINVFLPRFLVPVKPNLPVAKDDPSNTLSPMAPNSKNELSPIRKPLKEIGSNPILSSQRNDQLVLVSKPSHLIDTTDQLSSDTNTTTILVADTRESDHSVQMEQMSSQIKELSSEVNKLQQLLNQYQQHNGQLDKALRDRDLQIRELIDENKTLANQVQGNQKRLGDALDRRESLMDKLNKEQQNYASARGEVESWRREFYHAMAMAVKLCHASMGNPSNLSVQELVEEALRTNIPSQDYPEWLANKFRPVKTKKRTIERKPRL